MNITNKSSALPMGFLALGLVFTAMALPVLAEAPLKPAALPAGVVACNSLKNAQAYAQYTKIAPDFAKDMLDRANCFEAKERMEAVQTGTSAGFNSLKLLTGHVVWVPSGQVQAAAASGK